MQIERINRFDAAAFRFLYDNYYKALAAYACRLTGAEEVSEDIVQELFSTLLERKTIFPTLAALKAFMYNSVHNAALDYQRHRSVRLSYYRNVADRAKPFQLNAQGDEEVWDEEVYRLLFNAVDSLPARQREVFLLVIDGKKTNEIAKALGISIESVKTHKRRGMAFLRKRFGQDSLVFTLLMQAAFGADSNNFYSAISSLALNF